MALAVLVACSVLNSVSTVQGPHLVNTKGVGPSLLPLVLPLQVKNLISLRNDTKK